MAEMLKPEERKRLIQQKFNKTLEQIENFLKEEIKKIQSDFSKRGILHSGSYIYKVMEIKTNTIKKAVNERIAIEKEILQKEEKELTEEAEQELKAEIKEFIENRLKYLHQQKVEMLKKIGILSGDRLPNMINNDEMIKLTMYANREIDIMKNEIKLSKSTTHLTAKDYEEGKIPPEDIGYDAFISHASEDKEKIVRPLAKALMRMGFNIWYDEFELKVGDSLRRSIDKGLVNSRYGIIVFSKAFFAKNWPQYELNGLVAREIEGKKVILPIWHGIGKSDVLKYSPSLADKVAILTTNKSIKKIAEELAEVISD